MVCGGAMLGRALLLTIRLHRADRGGSWESWRAARVKDSKKRRVAGAVWTPAFPTTMSW